MEAIDEKYQLGPAAEILSLQGKGSKSLMSGNTSLSKVLTLDVKKKIEKGMMGWRFGEKEEEKEEEEAAKGGGEMVMIVRSFGVIGEEEGDGFLFEFDLIWFI
ncbi:hypothetical protein LINGRAHAP2_LOCUS30396 [Linum grandiflorum]